MEWTVVGNQIGLYRDWNYVHSGTEDVHLVHVTEPNYITRTLLPTFRKKPMVECVDPQFLVDFKRARPYSKEQYLAEAWKINGQRLPRMPGTILRILKRRRPEDCMRITQLYNQRAGIDLTRRVQGYYGQNHMVFPKSSSFVLNLKLLPGHLPIIEARARMTVFPYDCATGQPGPHPVDEVRVDATYDFSDGRAVYNLVKEHPATCCAAEPPAPTLRDTWDTALKTR
jgi:hypothetical protein